MYVCMNVCMYVCMYVYIYMYTYIYAYKYVYIHMCSCNYYVFALFFFLLNFTYHVVCRASGGLHFSKLVFVTKTVFPSKKF